MADIKTEHFDGHKNVSEAGSSGNKLSEILRGFVEELTDRIQSGNGTLTVGGELVVAATMPDTSYEVCVSFSKDPGAASSLFVKEGGTRTAAGFTIATNPVVNAGKVNWIARSRTRIHTKG